MEKTRRNESESTEGCSPSRAMTARFAFKLTRIEGNLRMARKFSTYILDGRFHEKILFGCDWRRDWQPCPVRDNTINGSNSALDAPFASRRQHQRLFSHLLPQFCIGPIRTHLFRPEQPIVPSCWCLRRLYYV